MRVGLCAKRADNRGGENEVGGKSAATPENIL